MTLFKSILYVTGADGDAALARAVALAQNNQARLTVVGVIPPPPAGAALPAEAPGPAELQASAAADRRKALDALIEPHRETVDVRSEVLEGTAFHEVIRAVLRDGHDLLVKRAEDPAWSDRLFGSDDMHLLRKCPCPVWLTKPDEKPDYSRILAAVDFDPSEPASPPEQALNEQILELAGSLAMSDFAELHVVHAWDAPAEALLRTWSDNPDKVCTDYVDGERLQHQNALDRLRERLREQLGRKAYDYVAPRLHLVRGPAAGAIPEQAALLNVDLIVMGTVGRTGLSGFIIGNTAEAILDQLQCSVVAVKPPGFVSPVRLDK